MLALCNGCGRHVRAADEACPFCGSAARVAPAKQKTRASRAAMLGVAAVALACGGTTSPGDGGGSDSSTDDSSIDGPITFYGGPPIDASPQDATPQDAAPDGPVAAYGGPPIDAGSG